MGPLRNTVTDHAQLASSPHGVTLGHTHTYTQTRAPERGHDHRTCWGRGEGHGKLQFTCSYIAHISTEKLPASLGVHTLRNSKNPLESVSFNRLSPDKQEPRFPLGQAFSLVLGT